MAHAGDDQPTDSGDTPLMTPEQLRAYAWGWGAKLMPVKDGWKVHYYSTPTFEEEPGTIFPTFAEAIDALSAVLPDVNSEEQKERAHTDLARLQATEPRDESASA